jgi:hypothetical protein
MTLSAQGRTIVALFAIATILPAQELSDPVVLTVEAENWVQYRGDTSDVTRLATLPGPTLGVAPTFEQNVTLADIVAVNGKPAKGLWYYNFVITFVGTSPIPGVAIADLDTGGGIFQCFWHILLPDGTFVGSLTDRGQGTGAGHIVVGGNGAFFGAIGEHRIEQSVAPRSASMSEDPSMRRVNGGGKFLMRFTLYPKFRPNVQMTTNGPAIFHEDFSQVTTARPARAGEVLIVRATGLGPTKQPVLDAPGARRFSANPVEEVNSPIEVTVNGNQAAVLNKIGWPGETNLYRVDFRVPDSTPAGTAAVRLTAACLPGSEVAMPVR